MSKEQFWKDLSLPTMRGCWNCTNQTLNGSGCKFDPADGTVQCDAYFTKSAYEVRVNGVMNGENKINTEEPNWLLLWEWDEENG